MKHLFKSQMFKSILGLLIILLIAKTVWMVVQIGWLPSEGVEQQKRVGGKSLYYRVKLTPNEAAAPATKKPVQIAGSIKDIRLIAVYNASDTTVVTVSYKRKSKILGRGDVINGFTLVGGGSTYATFTKGGKTYRVDLQKSKSTSASNSSITPASKYSKRSIAKTSTTSLGEPEGDIEDVGDHKIIDKSLVDHYAKNVKEIYKNIGIRESKVNGKTQFKITFVKRGSPFAKLGVKRGDIIKSLNGQEINSEAEAFMIMKDIDNIENITLGIMREKKEMELEYEIN